MSKCKCDYVDERNGELMRSYAKVAGEYSCKSISEAMSRVVNSPVKRFWVSPEEATKIVRAISRGALKEKTPLKKEMYVEIYSRFERKKESVECKDMSILDICTLIIEEQAPKFYISAEYAIKIFRNERKKNRDKNRKRYCT